MRTLKQFGLLIIISLFITSCGSSGDGGDSSFFISGTASKNLISGGTATAFAINEKGTKGDQLGVETTTGADGSFFIDIGAFSGNILIEVTGGTYTDEATLKIEVPNKALLRAAVTNVDGNISISVTPLTEIAVRISEPWTQVNIDQANALVSSMVGGFNITTTVPLDVTNSSSAEGSIDEKNYGLFLAAISQMIFDDPTESVQNIIDGITNDLLDKQLINTGLFILGALRNFVDSTNNETGLGLDETDLDESIDNATTSPISIESELSIFIDPNASGTVTSNPVGISCPEECIHDFFIGTFVTLTAAHESGFAFDGWGGESGEECAMGFFIRNADKSCTVLFTLNPIPTDVFDPNPSDVFDLGYSS